MGNICEFNDSQVLHSFDQYDQLKKSEFHERRKYQQSHSIFNQDLKDMPAENIQPQICCETAHSEKSIQKHVLQKDQENPRVHRVSITPPSQRDFALLKKLQQQSQVPSEFFQNIDFSLYFNTFKTLKENFDHFHHLNSKQSTNRTNQPFSSLSSNSINQYIVDKRNQLKDHAFQKRKPSEKINSVNQNLTIQELKKTKMYLTQLQISNR